MERLVVLGAGGCDGRRGEGMEAAWSGRHICRRCRRACRECDACECGEDQPGSLQHVGSPCPDLVFEVVADTLWAEGPSGHRAMTSICGDQTVHFDGPAAPRSFSPMARA